MLLAIIWKLCWIVIDNSCRQQDNSCIYAARMVGMRENPKYGLYATQGLDHWVDSVHIETIPTRSSLNNWVIKPHLHKSFIQILYLTRGGGVIGMDDKMLTVTAPCILSIPEQIMHSFHFSEDVDGPVITAVQHVLERVVGAADPNMLSVVREPFAMEFEPGDPALAPIAPLFDSIQDEFRSHRVGQPGICVSLLAALALRVGRIRYSRGLPLRAGSSRKAVQIQKFRELVDKYYCDHVPLSVYANELGVTGGHLTRLCRDVLGMSATAVISERLVHEAQRNLVYTSDPVKSLAWRLGFDDEVYFSRFFRKHTGVSPVKFREQARNHVERAR
ncbi:helix-turn-helix domain-containing protein [Castellaniella sp.]|uniref:helix-turn-helix domain-containing protein n=1 Tax=Castellaniella sp. TaxID=1955812 RepID=UPI003C706995